MLKGFSGDVPGLVASLIVAILLQVLLVSPLLRSPVDAGMMAGLGLIGTLAVAAAAAALAGGVGGMLGHSPVLRVAVTALVAAVMALFGSKAYRGAHPFEDGILVPLLLATLLGAAGGAFGAARWLKRRQPS